MEESQVCGAGLESNPFGKFFITHALSAAEMEQPNIYILGVCV